MKPAKNILILSFVLFASFLKAQIGLEATYDTAAVNLYMVTLEIDGEKYVKVKRGTAQREILLYNLNHSLWKVIDCSPFPTFDSCFSMPNNGQYNYEVLYISQSLFDSDNGIEFMYNVNACGAADHFTGIYNEDGSPIFTQDSAAPLVRLNVPIVFKPIYNTVNGTKMVLSFLATNQSKVYSLPGTLTNSNMLLSDDYSSDQSFSAYPNPSSGHTTINFTLPAGSERGTIVIYDLNGNKISEYAVDNTFDNLVLSTSELAQGTYLYSLISNGTTLETKKIVVAN